MKFTPKNILSLFDGCKNILDLGCGVGNFLSTDKRITGIDSNAEHLRVCRKKGLNAINGDVTNLSRFKDGSVDGIAALSIIEHLSPDEAYRMLRECHRVLRKGGILAILTMENVGADFWKDFSHVRPYPSASLRIFFTNSQPINDVPQIPFKVEKLLFEMRGFRGRGLFRLEGFSNWLATRLPVRRQDYLMVLRK